MTQLLLNEFSQALALASDVASNTSAIAANTAAIANANTANAWTTSTQHVYVASTGNDANDGTAAHPKLTMAGAYALLPKFLGAPFVIHFASGTYNYAIAPEHAQSTQDAFIVLVGDGAGQPADDGFTTVFTGTVGSSSTQGNLVTSGITASTYIGYTIEMTSGAAVGCRRLVNENTTTGISLDYPLVNSSATTIAATAGDTYRIVKPAVTLATAAVAGSDGYAPLSYGHAIHFVQLRLTSTVGTSPQSCGRATWFFGVEFSLRCLMSGSVVCGTVALPVSASGAPATEIPWVSAPLIYAAAGGTGTATKWEGWGICDSTGATVGIFNGVTRSTLVGYYSVLQGVVAIGGNEALAVMLGGRLQSVRTNTSGFVYFSSNTSTPIILSASTQSALLGAGAMTRFIVQTSLTVVQSGDFPAINYSGCSQLRIADGVTVTVTSTGAASNPCIAMSQGSVLQGGIITLSTTRNAFDLSDNAQVSLAALTATQALPSTIAGNAVMVVSGATSITGATGAAITMQDQAKLTCIGAATLTCTAASTGALTMTGPCAASFRSTTTITNSASGTGVDGVKAKSGAVFSCQVNPAITTPSATGGYACNFRGGGRGYFALQPSSAVGVTNDLSVGSAGGEDFADTSLSASLSYVVSGLSGAMRTT